MKVNIYYGGRGIIEDPTLCVINTVTQVLEELRVEVDRYNLYEEKSSISMLPKTLKEADGIILATHVEWLGIGGYMQQFLDSCWLYGDRESIKKLYMMPIVMSTTYGERDAENTLIKSWELLGGIPVEGLCAYVEDSIAFETNSLMTKRIEKKAEELYRSISQRVTAFPSSTIEIRKKVLKAKVPKFTPQETEQLSEYVSNDLYVKKQKEDIEELASMFKGMLGEFEDSSDKYISRFKNCFKPDNSTKASYMISLTDIDKELIIRINGDELECKYGLSGKVDVYIKISEQGLNDIISGRSSFNKAFMTGLLTAKGNFNTLRMLDTLFVFA